MRRRKYTITDIDSTVAVNFDNKAFVVSSMDLGSIEANISSYSGAGQYGSTITARSYGTRDITIEGHILADSPETMANRKAILQRIVVPTSDFYLLIDDDYKLRCTANGTIQYPKEWFRNNSQLTSFTIEATCANPFFETIRPQKASITGWIKDFHFPFSNEMGHKFTFGHRSDSKIVDVVNDSEIETGMIVTMKAVGGTIVNPYLQDAKTLEKFKLNKTLQADETVVINTNYGNKSIFEIKSNQNWLRYLDLSSTWLQMPVGVSSFKYGFDLASTGTLQCDIQYLPLMIEV